MNVNGLPYGLRLMCLSMIAAVGCTTTNHSLQSDRYVMLHDAKKAADNASAASSSSRAVPVANKTEAVREISEVDFDRGVASWYGPGFHGRKTANGEVYDQNEFTAAHRTLPFNTLVRVENLRNGQSVIVRINDRGPFVDDRVIDLSQKAARNLGMIGSGTAQVRLTIIDPDPKLDRKDLLSERFTLQVGSFSRPEHAESLAQDLQGSRVAEASIQNRVYYRVYYGMYATRRDAEDALMAILRKGHTGFVKQL